MNGITIENVCYFFAGGVIAFVIKNWDSISNLLVF